MRYITAVNHSGFGNHVMNFLVPRLHRHSIDDLELVCQSDEYAPIPIGAQTSAAVTTIPPTKPIKPINSSTDNTPFQCYRAICLCGISPQSITLDSVIT